jgi:hypothetical protein
LARRYSGIISSASADAERRRPTPRNNKSQLMSTLTDEIARRRTFAIISHPDTGKTT